MSAIEHQIEYPGPIDNYSLYMIDPETLDLPMRYQTLVLKEGLIRNQDYKMVNEHVWNLMYQLYGVKGGAILARYHKDIYSEAVNG